MPTVSQEGSIHTGSQMHNHGIAIDYLTEHSIPKPILKAFPYYVGQTLKPFARV